jgi:hypothetical protein
MALTHSQVAARWIAREVPSNGLKGHSMFCDRDTIYSYGYHFPIARFRDGLIFFNRNGYSKSTERHKSIVRRAIQHYQINEDEGMLVLELPHAAWSDQVKALEHYHHSIVDAVRRWRRARKHKAGCMTVARLELQQFKNYCELAQLDSAGIVRRRSPELAVAAAVITMNPTER